MACTHDPLIRGAQIQLSTALGPVGLLLNDQVSYPYNRIKMSIRQ